MQWTSKTHRYKASSRQEKSAGTQSKIKTPNDVVHGGAINMVIAGSGCNDYEKVEQVLLLMDGDVDAAIECLIAEREAGETVEIKYVCHDNDNKNDNEDCTKSGKHENRVPAVRKDQSTDAETVDCYKTSSKGDKIIPRNKVCPCGSKKKYKACCGAASKKTCSKVVVDHEADARRKRGKQGKKVIPISKAASGGSNDKLPDMGALCI